MYLFFFFFGCAELAVAQGFSPVAVHGLHCSGFSVAEHGSGVVSLITFTGLVAPQLVRSSPGAGIEPVSPVHWLAES